MEKLTPKQKAFADYYIANQNAHQAALKAGYGKACARQRGSENLNKPIVAEYIEKRMAKMASARIASAEEVLEYLTRTLRGETDEEIIIVEGTGPGISQAKRVQKKISAKDKLKAAELLGKVYAVFTEKLDISGSMGVQILDDLGDDQE